MSTNVLAWTIVEMAQRSSKEAQERAISKMVYALRDEGIGLEESKIFTCNYALANGFLSAFQIALLFTIVNIGLGYFVEEPGFYIFAAITGIPAIIFGGLYAFFRTNKRIVGFREKYIFLINTGEKKVKIIDVRESELYKRMDRVLLCTEEKTYQIKFGKENEYKYYEFLREFDLV